MNQDCTYSMHNEKTGTNRLPLFQSPLASTAVSRSQSVADSERKTSDAGLIHVLDKAGSVDAGIDDPQFLRHEQASHLELFYDLFLTANLTVFTQVHEVRDSVTLKQYAGFFCILWFTWYHVGLYDVRFSRDCIFERAAKAAQFLVMMGFTVVGPKYNVGINAEESTEMEGGAARGPSLQYFQVLTLFLMASRLVLVFQYVQSMYFTRHHKSTILPMSLIAANYFVAAMVYLGLYWSFHPSTEGKNYTYIVWYVAAISETILSTTVSSIWRNISFKGTHLVQRMGLLTLIILGEGVISVANKVQRIVKSEGALEFTNSTIGNITCAVVILYFIYMLYFDWIQEHEHFGTIMQQIWSFLHLPLHLALVLAVEGVAQCITWRAAVVRGEVFSIQYANWTQLLSTGSFEEAGKQVNDTATSLIFRGLLTSSNLDETLEMLTYDLKNSHNASKIISSGAENPVLAQDALYWIYFTLYKIIFNIAGFDSPVKRSGIYNTTEEETNLTIDFASEQDARTAVQSISRTARVFDLTYVYFFTSIGLVIILCCVIAAISQRRKTKWQWVRLIASQGIGLGLCLLSIADVTRVGAEYSFGPWLLPTVGISMGVVVGLNSVGAQRERGRGRSLERVWKWRTRNV